MAWRALEVNINSAEAQVCYVSGNYSLNSEYYQLQHAVTGVYLAPEPVSWLEVS